MNEMEHQENDTTTSNIISALSKESVEKSFSCIKSLEIGDNATIEP